MRIKPKNSWVYNLPSKLINGVTVYKTVVPKTGEVRWIDPNQTKDFNGIVGYRFYNDNGILDNQYTQALQEESKLLKDNLPVYGETNQAANERADEYTNRVSLTPERFVGMLGASVPLAAGALGATVAAPIAFNKAILPLSDYIAATRAGQLITKGLTNPYFTKGVESAFAAHGINHVLNEGIKGLGDAAMTALELAPLGKLTKPLHEGIIQPGMRLFNSPLTGKWTKIGSREYRLSPNSLGANGLPLEVRKGQEHFDGVDVDKMHRLFENYNNRLTTYKNNKINPITFKYKTPKIDFNNLTNDAFVDYLSRQIGKTVKRVPIKDTKHGDLYNEGFAFVDNKGRELAYIAGSRKGNKNVWVESSYVDPEYRYKGLGKQMYFDFNDHTFNTYGTTLHSSPMQRVGSTGAGMSPSNRLWKNLRDNGMSTIEGKGFDKYDVMVEPSRITTMYRNSTNHPEQFIHPAEAVGPKRQYVKPVVRRRDITTNEPLMPGNSKITITSKNAASITPKQWTAAQDAAIARGDMAEAQRLRDLHFVVNSPNNKAISSNNMPLLSYHTVADKYNPNFTKFNPEIEGRHSSIYTTDNPFMSGSYTTKLTSLAERNNIIEATRQRELREYNELLKNAQNRDDILFAKKQIEIYSNPKKARKQILNDHPWLDAPIEDKRMKRLYVNLENPLILDNSGRGWNNMPLHLLPQDVLDLIKPDIRGNLLNASYTTRSLEEALKAVGRYDGSIIKNVIDYGGQKQYGFIEPGTVFQVNKPNNIKLADAVTYDNNGVRIPLGKRDNFKINDIRYGLLPFGIGLTGYKFVKQ